MTLPEALLGPPDQNPDSQCDALSSVRGPDLVTAPALLNSFQPRPWRAV